MICSSAVGKLNQLLFAAQAKPGIYAIYPTTFEISHRFDWITVSPSRPLSLILTLSQCVKNPLSKMARQMKNLKGAAVVCLSLLVVSEILAGVVIFMEGNFLLGPLDKWKKTLTESPISTSHVTNPKPWYALCLCQQTSKAWEVIFRNLQFLPLAQITRPPLRWQMNL